jgi:hypothetical protein
MDEVRLAHMQHKNIFKLDMPVPENTDQGIQMW